MAQNEEPPVRRYRRLRRLGAPLSAIALWFAIALFISAVLVGTLWFIEEYPRVWYLPGLIILPMIVVVWLLPLLIRAARSQAWSGFSDKTLWDWLQLLIVPLVLVIGGFFLTTLQDARQRAIEDQRAQDTALQAYLDQMGNLLLEKDLRTSKEDSEVRTLARARTLTVLSKLDSSDKEALIEFLVEAELVQEVEGRGPIIGLRGAQLSDADLRNANLIAANLSYADLRNANLSEADLRHANLRHANLIVANLFNTDLHGADLSYAHLSGAYLGFTKLSGANLSFASLKNVAPFGRGNTDLIEADLSDADLHGANLSEADLRYADLHGANLSDAKGVTNKELQQQASTLEGATMPNGQKYEDWLKSKGSGKD